MSRVVTDSAVPAPPITSTGRLRHIAPLLAPEKPQRTKMTSVSSTCSGAHRTMSGSSDGGSAYYHSTSITSSVSSDFSSPDDSLSSQPLSSQPSVESTESFEDTDSPAPSHPRRPQPSHPDRSNSDRDSAIEVELKYQGCGGGYLGIRSNGDLYIVPPSSTSRQGSGSSAKPAPYDLLRHKILDFPASEGRGELFAFESELYRGHFITVESNYTVDGRGQSKTDKNSQWRSWNYKDVFPDYPREDFKESIVFQYWGPRYQFNKPKDGLFFVIECQDNRRIYKVADWKTARLYGAFSWD